MPVKHDPVRSLTDNILEGSLVSSFPRDVNTGDMSIFSAFSLNRILSGLPKREQEVLAPLFERKEVRLGEVLTEAGKPIETVFFPIDSAISMVNVQVQAPLTVDVALIGKEGCYGCSVVQGSTRSPSMFMVEVGGTGIQVKTSQLLQELPRLACLRAALDRYNFLLTRVIVISAGCSQFHPPSQRLARWLMAHYHRTGITTFPFSKQFLAAQTGLEERERLQAPTPAKLSRLPRIPPRSRLVRHRRPATPASEITLFPRTSRRILSSRVPLPISSRVANPPRARSNGRKRP